MEIQADGKILSIDLHNGIIVAYSELQQEELPVRAMNAGYLVFKDEARAGFDVRLKHVGYVYRLFPDCWAYRPISRHDEIILYASGRIGYRNREDAVGALIEAQAFSI